MSITIGNTGNALQMTIPTRGDVNWDYVMQLALQAIMSHTHDGLQGGATIVLGANQVTNAKLATMAANTVKANITGLTATPTDAPFVSTSTASSGVFRDANKNFSTNSVVEGLATTVTAGGTTTLIAASAPVQEFTGSTPSTVVLPDATTLSVGQQFQFRNRATPAALTIQTNGGGNIMILPGGADAVFTLVTNSVAAGTWDIPQGGQLRATTTNDNASASNIGEQAGPISRLNSAGTPLTTNVALNVTVTGSITLNPGDWEIRGFVGFTPAATTSITQLVAAVSKTTGALPAATTTGVPAAGEVMCKDSRAAYVPTALDITIPIIPYRVSLASQTSFYLVAQATFTVSTLNTFGFLDARRIR